MKKHLKRIPILISVKSWLDQILWIIRNWELCFGLDVQKFKKSFYWLYKSINEYKRIKYQNEHSENKWNILFSIPHFGDRDSQSGTASGQYFFQDLFVAREIYTRKPEKHVDVGSRVDGFVAHVAVFRKLEVFDIRPLSSSDSNIEFRQVDLLKIDRKYYNYCDSLSCLHALEHFGLGRYGDEIDLDGPSKGILNLYNLLCQNGILYLSLPIGIQRIDFNAHRVFSISTVLKMINGFFLLDRFHYIDDKGDFFENKILDVSDLSNSLNLKNGCGIFELKKIFKEGNPIVL